ncbi:MAG: acylneuraminate cytidylyltransferase family protein [Gammaproteobacteria bacterium]|nr:acylneuraminate cytidylyltransferase family protein [Gammaproteobacteria bacterium]
MSSNIAFVFARGGSKGIPRKNIKQLGGRPLIGWSIQTAMQCPSIDRIIVSTDDEEIAEVAKNQGAEVPFLRPKELAQDNSAEWYAWRHAVDYMLAQGCAFDKFISLPATSPLRSVEDVENCIAALDDNTDVVVTVKKAERSPFFNMVTMDEQGFSQLAITPDKPLVRRQDAPLVYDMTTVCYVTRPNFILSNFGVFSGKVRSVIIPDARAIDIDNPIDFKMAELLVNEMRA